MPSYLTGAGWIVLPDLDDERSNEKWLTADQIASINAAILSGSVAPPAAGTVIRLSSAGTDNGTSYSLKGVGSAAAFSVDGGGSSPLVPATQVAALGQLQSKAITEQSKSLAASQAGYSDTAASLFTELWASASANWAQGAHPGQVSGGRLYGGATTGTGSGQNHSYALAAGDNLRFQAQVNVPAGVNGDGSGIIIGVSSAAAGAVPGSGGSGTFGLYFQTGVGTNYKQMSNGAVTDANQGALVAGDYLVTVVVDALYISVTACLLDGTKEVILRRLRAGFAVNNLYIFASDVRALTGMSVGPCAARKGLQTISPRTTYGEGVAKSMHWTGNASTADWMVFLPANYDSRKPSPVVMCFHGTGSSETAWATGFDVNYPLVQRALIAAGYIVVSCALTASKSTWGNAASSAAYLAAYKYVRDNYAIGPVAIFCNSMGGIESLNTLKAAQIPGVVAWVGTSATTNLAANYVASFTSQINTAYSISGDYAAKTAGFDPNLQPIYSFQQLPMLFITATDDVAVAPGTNSQTFAPAVAPVSPLVTLTLTTGGHQFDVTPFLSAITSFIDSYAKV